MHLYPTLLSLTRQNLPISDTNNGSSAADLHKGAYIVHECDGDPDIIGTAHGAGNLTARIRAWRKSAFARAGFCHEREHQKR